ncbi:MAG TPA: hypothetical protein VHA77_16290 [Xanthobacteraceae bacterium]|jgi:hypothetical protein|nr:hypothetical protein [Xanthobacteraceae bacterium]
MKRRILLAALAAVSLVGSAATVAARTVFDGNWSVLIITDRGDCDRAYRYGVTIDNGIVLYRGGGDSLDLQGRVTRSGNVDVRIAQGNQRAEGRGRLSRFTGGGVWFGAGPTGTCSGRWSAERRSP